ncbi:MAG: MmcQ/YjbR family DNA-binding protein [Acidobacteriota bacterium]
MTDTSDPTAEIRAEAGAFPETEEGTSCNQTSFKVGGKSFLFVGPGPKARGCFKAMFKLKDSMPQAQGLAAERPDRFEVGSTGWVTVRFTHEEPLPRSVWEPWVRESYGLSQPKRSKR